MRQQTGWLVGDIYVPAPGAMTTIMIGGRANRKYMSYALREEGFRQAEAQLSRLEQQETASQLYREIRGEYKYYYYYYYYYYTAGVWGLE